MDVKVTFGSTDAEVMQLGQKLGWAKSENEWLRATIDKLKAMLPKCDPCNGTGRGGPPFAETKCQVCDGLGVVKP